MCANQTGIEYEICLLLETVCDYVVVRFHEFIFIFKKSVQLMRLWTTFHSQMRIQTVTQLNLHLEEMHGEEKIAMIPIQIFIQVIGSHGDLLISLGRQTPGSVGDTSDYNWYYFVCKSNSK